MSKKIQSSILLNFPADWIYINSLAYLKYNLKIMLINQNFNRWIIVSFFIFVLFLAFGLFSVSYTASLALFSGIALGLLAKKLFLKLARYRQTFERVLNIRIKVFFIFILLLVLLLLSRSFMFLVNNSTTQNILEMETYQVTIFTSDNNLKNFKIKEIAKLRKKEISKTISLIETEKSYIKKETQEAYLNAIPVNEMLKPPVESEFLNLFYRFHSRVLYLNEYLKKLNSQKESLDNLLSNPKIEENRLVGIAILFEM